MNKTNSRRNFFKKVIHFTSLGVAACSGVYIIGSAFKNLDGSLSAGAKSGTWTWQWIGDDVCVGHPCCGMYNNFAPNANCSGYEGQPSAPPPGCSPTCSMGGCSTSDWVPIYQCLYNP
jgi:hypothetical protein